MLDSCCLSYEKTLLVLSWMIFRLGTHESRGGPAKLAQASCWSLKMKSSRLSEELSPEREVATHLSL